MIINFSTARWNYWSWTRTKSQTSRTADPYLCLHGSLSIYYATSWNKN